MTKGKTKLTQAERMLRNQVAHVAYVEAATERYLVKVLVAEKARADKREAERVAQMAREDAMSPVELAATEGLRRHISTNRHNLGAAIAMLAGLSMTAGVALGSSIREANRTPAPHRPWPNNKRIG